MIRWGENWCGRWGLLKGFWRCPTQKAFEQTGLLPYQRIYVSMDWSFPDQQNAKSGCLWRALWHCPCNIRCPILKVLCLACINNIPESVSSRCHLFADNSIKYREANSTSMILQKKTWMLWNTVRKSGRCLLILPSAILYMYNGRKNQLLIAIKSKAPTWKLSTMPLI